MQRNTGFTLIELLIMIALISILISLLLPVYLNARQQANQIVCISNIRQIGAALTLYTTNYDERFQLR